MHTPAPYSGIASPRLSLVVPADVLLVHAGILAGIMILPESAQTASPPSPLHVKLIEVATAQPEPASPPVRHKVQPAHSVPEPLRIAPAASPKPAVEPVLPARSPLSIEPPQPAPMPAPAAVTLPAPVETARITPPPHLPVTQPRFNADYLDNPKPPYPSAARRMGEEGKVRLRVHVDISGSPGEIEIFLGSGYPRLDFWNAPGLELVAEHIRTAGVHDPFSHLTQRGLNAAEQYRNKTGPRLIESGSAEEFLTRALRRAIDQDTARLEHGHTMLASIASSAPFIGLFGTVWGIYHALVNIGMSGSGSLDQVAGPVGEALIMTALGLAVAIPAVLAYNFFNRSNRLMLNDLDGFAHDLFAFMATGVRNNININQDEAQVHTAPVTRSA